MKVVSPTLRAYAPPGGGIPFRARLSARKVKRAGAAVPARVDRSRLGNSADCTRLTADLYALRIHLGPGYRVCFAEIEGGILLLGGGAKRTQRKEDRQDQALLGWTHEQTAMNEAFVIENTGDYAEWLVEQLKDPGEALVYLEAAREA